MEAQQTAQELLKMQAAPAEEETVPVILLAEEEVQEDLLAQDVYQILHRAEPVMEAAEAEAEAVQVVRRVWPIALQGVETEDKDIQIAEVVWEALVMEVMQQILRAAAVVEARAAPEAMDHPAYIGLLLMVKLPVLVEAEEAEEEHPALAATEVIMEEEAEEILLIPAVIQEGRAL